MSAIAAELARTPYRAPSTRADFEQIIAEIKADMETEQSPVGQRANVKALAAARSALASCG